MDTFAGSVVSFLAILNPFALCLYLEGVVDELEPRQFARLLVLASLISKSPLGHLSTTARRTRFPHRPHGVSIPVASIGQENLLSKPALWGRGKSKLSGVGSTYPKISLPVNTKAKCC